MTTTIDTIICDLDGTLAINDRVVPELGRLRKFWPKEQKYCYNDSLNEVVALIVRTFMDKGVEIIYLSGRDDTAYHATREFLNRYDLNHNKVYFEPDYGWHTYDGNNRDDYICQLHMRKAGDNRSDDIIKWELFKEHIEPYYNVLFVLDDRDQMVNLWRDKLGDNKCLAVREGKF